jgi:hypothetical protein
VAANNSYSELYFGDTDAKNEGALSYDHNVNSLATFVNGSERMRIDSSGNLLVGKTAMNYTAVGLQYQVAGRELAVTNDQAAGTGNCFVVNRLGGDGSVAAWYRNSTAVGSISITASATSYNTTSDKRLKKNIEDALPSGILLDLINVRQFDWNVDGSHQRYGLIAQELYEVVPEAVHKPANEEDMMSVDFSKLVPLLVKEVQELRKRVAELEAK